MKVEFPAKAITFLIPTLAETLCSGIIFKENISEFRLGTSELSPSARTNAQGASFSSSPNGDRRRERPSEGPVAAPYGAGHTDGGRSVRRKEGRGILFGIHCVGGTATMNKGAAAAQGGERGQEVRPGRCDRVRGVSRKKSATATAAATAFLG